MTYGQIKAMLLDAMHRKDMETRVGVFMDDARTMLNDRLGLELLPLSLDADTNDVLNSHHLLYFYAAMRSFYLFIKEHETAATYNGLWEQQVDNYWINRTGTEPLVITAGEPMP